MRKSCLALLLAVAPLAAQQTLVVAMSGGGQFNEIADAIAAAAPGDTILVQAGAYRGFVLTKGVRILGQGNVSLSSDVLVTGIPVGETAVLRSLVFALLPAPSQRLDVVGNAGHVHLDGVSTSAFFPASIQDSAAVSATSSGIAMGLSINNSNVTLNECSLVGAPALLCDASEVALSNTSCSGSANPFNPPVPGMRVLGGRVYITGIHAITASGTLVPGASAPALDILGGAVTLDPDVRLTPTGSAPPFSGSASVGRVAYLQPLAGAANPTVVVHAPPLAMVAVIAGPVAVPPPALPPALFWPLGQRAVFVGNIPDSGKRQFRLDARTLGRPLALQAFVTAPGTVAVSTPLVIAF